MRKRIKLIFGLDTVRKKVFLLSKAAGGILVLFHLCTSELPVSRSLEFLIWFVLMLVVILSVDYLLGKLISNPLNEINNTARQMAKLDFNSHCKINTDDEFGELASSLNIMAKNLQEALSGLEAANIQLERDMEQKQRLLSERKELTDHLSHEMKTPLGIISAYAEGLQDENDEARRLRYSQIIIAETERMNKLISTLLDLSALETGSTRLYKERFDFVEFLETVAGRLLLDIPDADFELQCELPNYKSFVCTDMARMEQVLNNLIVNAKKNVRGGGIIKLSLYQENGMLNFSIYNQGHLIPTDMLDKVWRKFYRSSNSTYSGSGLGLAITAQILSMQNLPYGVENRLDGVRFYFSIPTVH